VRSSDGEKQRLDRAGTKQAPWGKARDKGIAKSQRTRGTECQPSQMILVVYCWLVAAELGRDSWSRDLAKQNRGESGKGIVWQRFVAEMLLLHLTHKAR